MLIVLKQKRHTKSQSPAKAPGCQILQFFFQETDIPENKVPFGNGAKMHLPLQQWDRSQRQSPSHLVPLSIIFQHAR